MALKVDRVEDENATWWECADVLLGLAEGKGMLEQQVTAATVDRSLTIGQARERKLSQEPSARPRAHRSASDSTTASDIAPPETRRRSSSRVVSAEREMDILAAMLSGEDPELSQAMRSPSGFIVDIAASAMLRDQSVSPGPHLSFADSVSPSQAELNRLAKEASGGTYENPAHATSSSSLYSGSFSKSARSRLKSASKGGLPGLKDLLKTFRMSTSVDLGVHRSATLSSDSLLTSDSHAGRRSAERSRKDSRTFRRLSQMIGASSDAMQDVPQGPPPRNRLFSFGSSQAQAVEDVKRQSASPPPRQAALQAGRTRSDQVPPGKVPTPAVPELVHPAPPSSYKAPASDMYQKLTMKPEALPSLLAYLQVTKTRCEAHLAALELLSASAGASGDKAVADDATVRSPRLDPTMRIKLPFPRS